MTAQIHLQKFDQIADNQCLVSLVRLDWHSQDSLQTSNEEGSGKRCQEFVVFRKESAF